MPSGAGNRRCSPSAGIAIEKSSCYFKGLLNLNPAWNPLAVGEASLIGPAQRHRKRGWESRRFRQPRMF
jgi:hypothetical protein